MDPLDPLNRAAAKIHFVLKTRQTSSRSCLQLERQTKSLLLMLLLKALVKLLTLLWLRSFYAKIVEPALGSSTEFLVLAVGALRRFQTCTIFSKHSLYQKLLHILLSRSVYFTLFLFLSFSFSFSLSFSFFLVLSFFPASSGSFTPPLLPLEILLLPSFPCLSLSL